MLSTKRTKITISIPSSYLQQASPSAEEIANNDDLLIELLLRLPVKSLLKFKSVSKHWLSLISNPHFSFRLNLFRRPTSGLFLCNSYSHLLPEYDFINLHSNPSRAPFKSLTFVNDPSGIKVLQSCNGLLLCNNFRGRGRDYNSFRGRGRDYNYYIFNSMTKQYTTLPPLRVKTGVSRTIFGVNLAFGPSKSPHYKVICVRNCDSLHHGHYQIEIYSPETGPWRLSGGTFTGPTDTNFNHGVFWKGAIHWISPSGTCFYFNVDEEKLRDMPMPPIPEEWDERRRSYFGESGGHLHLIENYGPGGAVFNVLEMERDYSGWFVKYRVDLLGVATAFPEMISNHNNNDPEPGLEELNYYVFSVLCVVREENDEDSYLVLQIPKKAIRYNFKDQTFKKIHDFAPSEFDVHEPELERFDVFQHIESLASV